MTLMLNLAKKIIKALRSRNDDGGLNEFPRKLGRIKTH